MASVTTSEFVRTSNPADAPPFSLIEQKGLIARLAEELARASGDLARNPREFIRDLFTDDERDAKRRRRIYIGLACAVVAHVVLVALIAFLGWRSLIRPKEVADNYKVEIVQFPPKSFDKPDDARPETPRGDDGGGGSGGNHSTLPASKGPLPQIAPAPQIVKALAPTAMNPALPVTPKITGPESPPPPAGVELGIPTGVPSEAPSPGPGEGDGIGGNKGSGAGSGDGDGAGPGVKGGKSSKPGNYGSSEGTNATPSIVDWRRPPQSGYVPFAWIYKARAVVTPEAQEYKIVGTVLLRATFHADGRITDIEIVNRVPYMTESAIEALSRSKFRPATINGVPITLTKVLVKQEVHY
ncbi:MAG TPA: TonB family protein [Blastocatellia bacterium]|nr:TonB family protein [Blastocatellia bacterium]